MNDVRDLIIIGGGPAGYTAALYAARANLQPLVIEGFNWGGQLMITSDVENYPGYADGIMGPEMMAEFRRQAERFGTEFVTDNVTRVDFSAAAVPRLGRGRRSTSARSVIVATGASARWLGLDSEERLKGRGVSACATCDGAFFRDKHIVVVGGGDSAFEEALFLTRFGYKVTLVHRRDEFRASPDHGRPRARAREDRVQDAVRRSTKCSATQSISGVRLRNTETGRDGGGRGRRALRRDRPRPEHEALRRPARPRRERLPRDEARARPRRTSPASSRPATSRITSTARRSPPPAAAAWPRSTPSASSPRSRERARRRRGEADDAGLGPRAANPRRDGRNLDRPARPDAGGAAGEGAARARGDRARAAPRAAAARGRAAADARRATATTSSASSSSPSSVPERGQRLLPGDRHRHHPRDAPDGAQDSAADGRPACDVAVVQKAAKPDDSAGMLAYRLVDEIAERYLDLVDALDDEIDELEDKVETQAAGDDARARSPRSGTTSSTSGAP